MAVSSRFLGERELQGFEGHNRVEDASAGQSTRTKAFAPDWLFGYVRRLSYPAESPSDFAATVDLPGFRRDEDRVVETRRGTG